MTKYILAFVLAVTIGFMGASAHASKFDQSLARDAWATVAQIEQDNGIPYGLLHAVSLVESGKGLAGKMLPWPYTAGVNRSRLTQHDNAAAAVQRINYLRTLGFSRFNIVIDGQDTNKLSAAVAKAKIQAVAATAQQFKVRGRNFAKRFRNKASAVAFVEKLIQHGHKNVDIGLMQVNWMYHGKNFSNVAEAFEPRHNAGYAVKYLKQHKQTRGWWASVGRYHSGTKKHAKRYIKNVWAMYRRIHRLSKDGTPQTA